MFSALTQKGFELAKDASIAPVLQEQIKLIAMQLEITETKLESSEKNIAKLEIKNENLEKELTQTKTEFAKLDGSAKLVDIGPCYIKEDKEGNKMQGFYCLKCKVIMERNKWGSFDVGQPDEDLCRMCNMMIHSDIIDKALQDYNNKKPTTP